MSGDSAEDRCAAVAYGRALVGPIPASGVPYGMGLGVPRVPGTPACPETSAEDYWRRGIPPAGSLQISSRTGILAVGMVCAVGAGRVFSRWRRGSIRVIAGMAGARRLPDVRAAPSQRQPSPPARPQVQ
jgi:hypothetical protein